MSPSVGGLACIDKLLLSVGRVRRFCAYLGFALLVLRRLLSLSADPSGILAGDHALNSLDEQRLLVLDRAVISDPGFVEVLFFDQRLAVKFIFP